MRESGEQAAEHREIFRFSASIWGSKPIMPYFGGGEPGEHQELPGILVRNTREIPIR